MVSFLVIFCCCFFLMKLPFIILGLLLRFIKPLTLIGFGCFVGVTLTTGVPDPNVVNQSQGTAKGSSSDIDFPDIEEFVSPALVEAALSTVGELTDSITELTDQMQERWAKETESKITVARNSSGSDFRAIDKSLRKR